jgi:outer membrane protein TolC
MTWKASRVVFAMIIVLVCGTTMGAQQAGPQKLTLNDAIALALKNNLSVRVAGTQVSEAQGTREREFSVLLPRVTGDSFAKLQNSNLAILGVSVPGIPTVVGPFAYYDFRAAANQSLINRQAYHSWKASQDEERAAQLDYQDARDLVIRQTAGYYLAAESALAEVQAAESRVNTSVALKKLAQDQRDQGLATGIDVVRAQVQLARDQQVLLVARDNYETSLLVLARFLGLQPGAPLQLAEQLEFKHVELPSLDQAVQTALLTRPDYRALFSQRESLAQQQKASHDRYYPTFSISGDYGALGRNFGAMPGIGEIQATVSVTLFDRDRNGEQKQLASQAQRLDAQMQDLARGVEEEIRKAVLDLQSTEQQVTVTQQALDLAQKELTLAEDRFRNGVTDNIEVITAQDAVAAAQDDRISALATHADASAALARALGGTEQNYRKYLYAASYPSLQNSGTGEKP